MSETKDSKTKVTLPYRYDQNAPVELEAFPKAGDRVRAIDPSNDKLRWAMDNNQVLLVNEIEFEDRTALNWFKAGYIYFKFTSTEGKKKYPGEHGGIYFHRFELVEQAKTEDEQVAELNNLIVVQQEEDERRS